MHVIRSEAAPQFELPGIRFAALAAPSRGSREVCTWRITVEPNLRSPEPHTINRDEVFMVTSGAIQLTPDGDTLGPGDACVVPAGQPIQLVNPKGEPARRTSRSPPTSPRPCPTAPPYRTPPWAS